MLTFVSDIINKHIYDYKSYNRFIIDIKKYGLKLIEVKNKKVAFGCTNGCGSKGGFKFPSFFLLICIIVACHIHDIEWTLAKSYKDLIKANENFDNNLKLITDYESKYEWSAWFYRQLISYYISGVERIGTPIYAKERGFS